MLLSILKPVLFSSQTPASKRNGSLMTPLPPLYLYFFPGAHSDLSLLQPSMRTDTRSSRSQQQIHIHNKTFAATSHSKYKFPFEGMGSRGRENPSNSLPCQHDFPRTLCTKQFLQQTHGAMLISL